MRRRSRAARLRSEAIRKTYRTEGSLCDAFALEARSGGFQVHAETSGWDLLLVRGDLQVGVQAKLRPNLDVLVQALPPQWRMHENDAAGPDVRAVLVPDSNPTFNRIAAELGIAVFDMNGHLMENVVQHAKLWDHGSPEWVPPCEITAIGGGRSGPVQITEWKVAAMALCERVRERGHVTRNDFRELRISPSTWVRCGWLRVEKVGRQWRYLLGETMLPDERWPEIAKALSSKPTVEGLDRRRHDEALAGGDL